MSDRMITHYLPAFTSVRQRLQMAVCGKLIEQHEHSAEPSCDKCQRWIDADEKEAKVLAAQWDAEDAAKRASAHGASR